jgi:hypothetical protein
MFSLLKVELLAPVALRDCYPTDMDFRLFADGGFEVDLGGVVIDRHSFGDYSRLSAPLVEVAGVPLSCARLKVPRFGDYTLVPFVSCTKTSANRVVFDPDTFS